MPPSPRSRSRVPPRTTYHQTGYVGALNREWALICTTPASAAAVRAWACHDPALARYADLVELESAVRTCADRDQIDEIFLALIRTAATDATWAGLASRTLLQLMLPKAVAIYRSQWHRVADAEERISAVIACMYEVIRTYPIDRRPTKIAANIGLDTLSLVQRRAGRATEDELPVEPADPRLALGAPETDVPESPDLLRRAVELRLIRRADAALADVLGSRPQSPGQFVLEVLACAVEERVLSAADGQLLAQAYLDGGATDEMIAHQLGLERTTVCKRRLRAVRALTEAAPRLVALTA